MGYDWPPPHPPFRSPALAGAPPAGLRRGDPQRPAAFGGEGPRLPEPSPLPPATALTRLSGAFGEASPPLPPQMSPLNRNGGCKGGRGGSADGLGGGVYWA
eukprot:TRINITY_DN4630_c0_g1_i2.p2 TRINITY_DN4630_c0_g1~~TRINITY_DN4630_c0_g1_i2.p2  ORF type:complete len:101 (+),score=15.23 TRINITY_DN4630_c0_g1_i2:150-452(+)